MGLKATLQTLVEELDRAHRGASPWSDEDGLPDFVTSENGLQRHFTKRARDSLKLVTEVLYQNRLGSSLKIELENYLKVVRQVVADMHADGRLDGFCEQKPDASAVLAELKALIEDRVSRSCKEFTHYVSAWTLGMEKTSPFVLGPVTFLNPDDWIASVDFPTSAKDTYLNAREANHRWKSLLKESLENLHRNTPPDGLAGAVHGAVTQCPALLKVTIVGYDLELSRKLAKLVCKSALDAVSLGFGAPECFHQQALYEERLPPFGSSSLVETNGFLWLPGLALGSRVSMISQARVAQGLVDIATLLPAFSSILESLVKPSTHKHPKLASRWATALDWFGEGTRESSDAIAVAKLGTCLDVLSAGGKYAGIRDMVVAMTGTAADTQVVGGSHPRTLDQLIKEIYDYGRSKILHGTHHDRLEPFKTERLYASHVARIVLIECATRLQCYTGDDDHKAFRTMSAARRLGEH